MKSSLISETVLIVAHVYNLYSKGVLPILFRRFFFEYFRCFMFCYHMNIFIVIAFNLITIARGRNWPWAKFVFPRISCLSSLCQASRTAFFFYLWLSWKSAWVAISFVRASIAVLFRTVLNCYVAIRICHKGEQRFHERAVGVSIVRSWIEVVRKSSG